MKLNHECVRDMLLAIEENDDLDSFLLNKLYNTDHLEKYDEKTIIHTIRQLISNGLVDGKSVLDGDMCYCIHDITPIGYQVLSEIRDSKKWTKLLKTVLVNGVAHLPTIIKTINTFTT